MLKRINVRFLVLLQKCQTKSESKVFSELLAKGKIESYGLEKRAFALI